MSGLVSALPAIITAVTVAAQATEAGLAVNEAVENKQARQRATRIRKDEKEDKAQREAFLQGRKDRIQRGRTGGRGQRTLLGGDAPGSAGGQATLLGG